MTGYDIVTISKTKLFESYFYGLIEQGIYMTSSQYETAFVSAAHSEGDIEKTLLANMKALKSTPA